MVKIGGIDDVCKRKCSEYFIILVDQSRRKIVDLIQGRDVETISEWLKKFSNIKILSRDGSTSYKIAIEKANANMIQVSDRFHLIKGLSEVLSKYIRKKYSKNIILTQNE